MKTIPWKFIRTVVQETVLHTETFEEARAIMKYGRGGSWETVSDIVSSDGGEVIWSQKLSDSAPEGG